MCIMSAIFGAPVLVIYGLLGQRMNTNKRLRRATFAAAFLFVVALISWPIGMYVTSL